MVFRVALLGLILLCMPAGAQCADWVYVGMSPAGDQKISFDAGSLEAMNRKILRTLVRMEYLSPEFTMDSLRYVKERRELREIDCRDFRFQGIEFTEYYTDGDSWYTALADWHVNHNRWVFVTPDSVDGMLNKAACWIAEERLKKAPIGRVQVPVAPPPNKGRATRRP